MITTIANIENYLLIDIDASFNTQITDWINAIELYINGETDRKIIADSTDIAYKYDGQGKRDLVIDDFISIASVTVDTNDVTTEILKYPANTLPITKIRFPYSHFAKGSQNVVVTGKQGYCASGSVPGDLVLAATVFVAGIINYSNASQGEVQSETIGRYSVTYSSQQQTEDFNMAKATLKQYKRYRY